MAKIDLTKEQAEMMQISLDSEKKVLKELEKNYQEAISEIEEKIAILQARQDADLQHVVYQIEYQKALKEQAKSALDKLHNSNFETISAYLTKSYETGFIGTLYDMQGQGVPLMIPLNPENMIRAITEKTKLKTSLYEELGFDIKQLSKQISSEISRGFARASTYKEIARGIEEHAGVSKNNSMRIARTEAHRIENEAIADCQEEASKKGADIVRIWSAALDGRTRPTHRKLDGQIREVGEPFEVDGMKVMQPGGFGIASEDINCRCRLNGRARWALDVPITKYSPDAPALISDDGTTQFVDMSDAKNYEEFKEHYSQATIHSPISARNNSRGKPSAISQYDVPLNSRQKLLLQSLPEFDSSVIVNKSDVSMTDISALTAATGSEFAMFTNGSRRLIIRGSESMVNVTVDKAREMAENGYRWSGHTHPGYDYNCLIASGDDYEILRAFGQTQSVTYNSLGQYLTYELE